MSIHRCQLNKAIRQLLVKKKIILRLQEYRFDSGRETWMSEEEVPEGTLSDAGGLKELSLRIILDKSSSEMCAEN